MSPAVVSNHKSIVRLGQKSTIVIFSIKREHPISNESDMSLHVEPLIEYSIWNDNAPGGH